jgi:predicted amidohydrolase
MTVAPFLAAVVQLNGSSDVERNLQQAEAWIRRAAAAGARLIATPEATSYLGPHDRKVALAEPTDGPTHQRFAALARELGVTLLIGSVGERCEPGDASGAQGSATRCYNSSLVYGPDGALLAAYRKLHLFDVDLAAAGGVRFRESERTAPGDAVVVADTPVGRLGLSICFDMRFPELYRRLHDHGADILCVPSAFTLMTGKDHWHPLLRARAIENQSWLLAPAQWGAHDDQGLRRSYGHSLIIDPWGTVVAECGDAPGMALAEIDLSRALDVRRQIPIDSARRLC